jgi:hypothetical protein
VTKVRTSLKATPRRKSARKPSALERLEPGEALPLLHLLLSAHPDLRPEAERMARSLVSDLDFEAVAEDVEHDLRALDIDDLNDRAGAHRNGYTPPEEAAWELLQEVIDPFVADMTRQLELRLEAAALGTCKGIVLGLYRVRRQGGGACLEWAPDFPNEAAAQTLRALAGRESAKGTRAAERPRLDATFVGEYTPEWREFISRCQGRG